MCWKNMIIWKKKSKSQRLNQFIEDFILFIKQCYYIVWNVEKIQKVKNPKDVEIKNQRIKMCDSKETKFIKEQRASRLLSSLGIKAPLSKIPLVGPILF